MSEEKMRKYSLNMRIVGVNLLVLAGYTIISRVIPGGFILNGYAIIVHFILCLIKAIIHKSWIWLLTAIMVLLIGCSTCANIEAR